MKKFIKLNLENILIIQKEFYDVSVLLKKSFSMFSTDYKIEMCL